MTPQQDKAARFKSLHVKGTPLQLFNIWDAGSAKIVADSGAKALATGSASVAMAHGFTDAEKIPLALVLENIARIVAATELPVSLDFEGAYGVTHDAVAETTRQAVAAGAIGFNFEDQIIGGEGLYPVADQCARLDAMRGAADRTSVDIFINARTDIFLKNPATNHDATMVDEALMRAHAYARAGATGFFVPGLRAEALLAKLCAACPLPLNVMMMPDLPPVPRLAALGVARISHGPGPYRLAMKALKEAATAMYAG